MCHLVKDTTSLFIGVLDVRLIPSTLLFIGSIGGLNALFNSYIICYIDIFITGNNYKAL